MNAFDFLGQERIDALKKGGMSDIEIRDYAKNKWLGEQNTPKVTDEPSLNIQNYDENLTNQATTDKPAKPQIEASDAAAQEKDAFSKLGDEIINEINPRASEPRVQNLGADGLPIPQAPIANETASEKSFFQDAYDAVEGFVKGAKKTAKAVYEDSIFGDYGTGAGKDDKAKVDIAKAQNTNGLISTLLQSDDEKAAERKKLQSDYDEIAKKYGYDLGAIVKGENIYFGKTAENGEIKTLDVTPSFTNQIAANKGEILGSIGAGFLPGGLAAKVGYSAIGAGAGAMRDRAARSEALGREVDTADMIKRGLQASADDLAAAAVIGGVVKGAQAAYRPALNATKATVKAAGDIADKMPLANLAKNTLKGLPTANVEGGLNAIKANSGSAAEEMLQRGERVGGYSVDNDNLTDLAAIADKPIKFVKEHLAKTADKLRLDAVSEFINNAEGMSVKQKKILDLGLSDTGSVDRILNAVRTDKTGKSAENLAALAKSDVEALRQILPSDGEPIKGELSGTLKEYFARVKDDFGAAEDDIAAKLAGKKTTLNSDAIEAAKKEMEKNADVFYSSAANEKLYETLDGLKNKDFTFEELRNIKTAFNRRATQIYSKENGYFTKVDTSNVGKIIDDALLRLLDDDKPLKELYLNELKKYSRMKRIEDNKIFKNMLDENIDEYEALDLVLKAVGSQGDLYNGLTKELNKEELERFESRLLNSAFKSQIWEVGKGEVKTPVFDGVGLEEILRKLPIKSPKAAQIKDAMTDMATARRNVAAVLVKLDESASKAIRPRAGIATTAEGAAKALWINVLKQKAFKYIGKLGDDAALEYHLQEALKALKLGESLKSVKQNLKNSGIDERVADAVNTSVKEFEYLSKKMDTSVKFGENLAKTNPNLYQGLMEYRAIDMPNADVLAYERVASEVKAKDDIGGEGWTMTDGGAAKTDYVVKTDLAPNARDLSKITTDEISADLEYLAGKHPEIFDKPSDVFRLIKEIKENPTHFFTNNKLDYALIVNRLENRKIGKLAIDKQSGEVRHATKVKDKDLRRLAKVSKEKSGNTGIIQTFARSGSELENRGLGYQDELIISQKGNLVNEKDDGLRNSISDIGDNASRASGRRPSKELQIADNFLRPLELLKNGDKAGAGKALEEALREAAKEYYGQREIGKSLLYALKPRVWTEADIKTITGDVFAEISKARKRIENEFNIAPIKEFGTNYAEFYRDGDGAIRKLLKEKNGQVAGAFYRKELGDIDLVWGKVWQDEKGALQGYGLAKIEAKHPEINARILNDVIKLGKAEIRQNEAVRIEKDGYKIVLKSNWLGEKTPNKWIVTAYEKSGETPSISSDVFTKGDNLPSTADEIIPQNEQNIAKSAFLKNGNLAEEENLSALRAKIERENNITPIKDFGINYAEFYHDGVGAVNKLLAEKRGQVAGAFYRKELGDIDLVWGNEQIGLNKILSKHEGDFKEFGGVASGLEKIVKDGRIADKNGVLTIFCEQNGKTYAVGLSKGWFGEGDNKWVITAYEKKNLGGRNETLSAYASLSGSKTPEPTAHNGIIPQNENLIDKEILDDIRAWDDESVPNENYAKQIIEKDGEEYHVTDKNHNNFSLEELKDKDNYTLWGGVVNQKMSGKEIKEFFAKADNDIMSEENLAKGANDGNQERGRQSGGDIYRRGNTEIRGQREGRSSDDVVSKQDGRDDVGGIRGVNQEAGARSELANDNPHSLSSDGDAYADAGGRLPRGDELRDRRIHAGYDTKNAGVDEGGRQARVKPEDERLRSPFEDFTAKIDENLDLSKLKEPTKGKDAFSSALNEAKILTPSEAARVKDYHIDAPRSYGGEIERLNENIEAITTLKELEKSGAIPTKEQQEILSRYNGWGGLSQAFDENNPKLGMRSKAFLDTLSDEELQSAKSSVNSSFYTPHDVVERIYDQIERLGFKGGEVLEPSVGIGNFFGLMPRNLKDASNLTGVEIDNLTARIARKLYPNAQIINEGYQKFNPIKKYDLVISNPPFSSSPIYDNVRKNLNGLNMHSYFALKNLELTKENGLNVLVVTHSLADSKEGFLRSEIDRLSKIVSAVRLPSNGFKDTATVTDVFFLVKRSDEEIAKGIRGGELNEQFLNLAETVDKNGNEIEINGLFANNPRLVMGDSVLQSGRFGDEVAVKIDNRYELAGRMKRALDETDISGVSLNKGEIVSEPQRLIKAYEKYGTAKGSVFEHNGKFYKKRGEYETDELKEYELLNLGKDTVEYSSAYQKRLPERLEEAKKIVKAVDGLRETLFKLKSGELSGDLSDGELGKLRSELGKRYADFKKDFGYISNPKIAKIYEGDPTYSHLSALEKGYKREKINGKIVESADRADIFSKRVLTPYVKPAKASSIEDATKISLNEYGRIDYERIGSLLGKDADAVKKEILDKKLGFLDENGNIVEKDEFLSGNVKQKLARLEANNEDGSLSGGIEEIKKVIPQDIQTADIGINAGANWIPKDVYQKFMRENIGSDGLTYDKWNGWKVDGYSTGAADANFGVIGEYKQVSAADVWEAAMNNTFLNMDKSVKNASGVTQTLRDEKGNLAVKNAIRDVKRAFEEFVLNDDEINKRVGKIYNDLFNTDVLKSYDGSYLTLPGKNENINLRTHQSNAVSRIITQNNTLLDHTVGTGKTYTMISAAMELRRLKLANKPLIVAPKAVVEQWGKEFATLYPNANVLTITEFDAASRKKTVASISAGDWDAVILSHDNFGMLKIKPETEARFINEEIKELEAYLTQAKRDGETGRINVKGLQQSLDNRRAKLEAINSAMDKDEAYFEDLGVDALFVDEAHMYKNLGFYTKMNRIKGLGNAKGSQRANDMFNKTRILNENGKKIVFATGTPIVNTIAELYTMQRYLGLNELNRLGITNFDEWAKLYGKVESNFEITPLGKYELKERFSSFVNLPELVKKYGYFADSIDGNDVKAALESEGKNFAPPVEKIRVLAGRSKDQTEYMKLLDERYEALKQKSGKPQKGDDNALSITNDAKKASLDMRLIDPLAPDFEGSKVNLAVKNAIKIYRRFQGVKGTQLICCDLSTPKLSQKTRAKLEALKDKALKGDEEAALKLEEYADEGVSLEDSFSVYEDMREKLIKGGVKEDEIAFIHDYDTDVKRKELFEKVNSGDIRIVFGSTKKIGTGVNIQKRITALHNLDVPWTPADLIQRVGRVERQGNELLGKIENFNVKVFDYATENMLDAMNWQTIETKLKFINQLKKGESAKRTAEDLSDDVVDAATMKALASGNPDILKEIELRREIDELNADRIRWHKANAAVNDRAGYLARQIESLPGLIADIGKDADSILPKDEKNFFTVGGKSYEAKQREKALTDINDALKRLGENKSAKIGEYRGFDVVARKIYLGKYKISLQNNSVYELSDDIGLATSGFFTRLDNALNSVSKELNAKKALIPAYKKELGGLKGALKPWGRENELRMLNKRHDEIMLRLKEKE